MSKAILLSIKPKYVADILNGRKTIEVRKSIPKCDLPIDVYIYCTKDDDVLLHCFVDNKDIGYKLFKNNVKHQYWLNNVCFADTNKLNGKVVAKFRLRKVVEYPYISDKYDELIGSCLSEKELLDYSTIQYKDGIRFVKTIYAWHIEDLVIFNEPKRLTWFRGMKEDVDFVGKPYKKFLKRPPQSYCFIESEE